MASEFLQKIRRSNGFYNVNRNLPEGVSGDSDQFSNFTNAQFNEDRLILESLWKTEYHCPEILPYPVEIIEKLKEAVAAQQDKIDEKVDEGNPADHFTIQMYQMEIERVRFLICNFMKIRLMKLQKQKEYILNNLEILSRLSTTEREFLSKLANLDLTYIDETISKRLSPDEHGEVFQSHASQFNYATPKFSAFVFCQALEDIKDLIVGEEQIMNYRIGDIFVVRYKAVRSHVIEGKVQLI